MTVAIVKLAQRHGAAPGYLSAPLIESASAVLTAPTDANVTVTMSSGQWFDCWASCDETGEPLTPAQLDGIARALAANDPAGWAGFTLTVMYSGGPS